MQFDVLTLFPEMFEPLKQSIIGRASQKELININLINIRDFSQEKHKHVDDTPYGGGAGMVMRADVVYDAYTYANKKIQANGQNKITKVIYLTPQGKLLKQKKVIELSKMQNIILICGHYEGIDQRGIEKIQEESDFEEISIGDYVLTGGEIPAMVLIDSISRYVDGVLTEDSIIEESFSNNLLEYPQYTRPEEFMGKKVPEVLLSGHHENIRKWRQEKALEITRQKRPDILENLK